MIAYVLFLHEFLNQEHFSCGAVDNPIAACPTEVFHTLICISPKTEETMLVLILLLNLLPHTQPDL